MRIHSGEPMLFVALFMAAGSAALVGQAPTAISNTDHRPLVGALDAMQCTLGVAINYEDVPYENEADLEDVATSQHRASAPGFRLLVPRRGSVSGTVRATTSETERLSYVEALLGSYRTNGMPGDFKVEQASGMLYVIPTKVLTVGGALRDVNSPMTSPITVSYAERPLSDTVAAILQAASAASGARIELGSLPFMPPTAPIAFGANAEPARDALAKLFARVSSRPVSYRLLFDPKFRAYMLNIQIVPPTNARPAPTGSPAPPGARSTENPFFTKTKK